MMARNDFCVNDKALGSVWGTCKTWDDFNIQSKVKFNHYTVEMEFFGVLNDWNGKRYVWVGKTENNYFIEI